MWIDYTALLGLQKLLFSPLCRFCGGSLPSAGRICYSCGKEILAGYIGNNSQVFSYEGAVAGLIRDLREREGWNTQALLLQIMRRKGLLKKWRGNFDFIVLAPSSQRNGLDDFARQMAREIQVPYLPCLGKKTRTQHDKNAGERMDTECFVYVKNSPSLAAKKILLLDDVCTTGTTLEMSAYQLRKEKAIVTKMALARKVMPSLGGESQNSK